jgi:hypothetical protein
MTLTEITFWLDLTGLMLACIIGITWAALRDRKGLDQ